MESTNFHKLQTKKATKPRKHHGHLRKIGNLLRYVEVCVVLFLISRLSLNLPTTLKNSTEYFRNFMGSPRFVFFLGNVIIITLFAQSGHFSKHSSPQPDLYLEFLQNSTVNHKLEAHVNNRKPKLSVRAESGVKGLELRKVYRRCQSEIVKRVQIEKPPRVLQRCETDKDKVASDYPEDGMSNDEFRCKVEAFIARQQRLRTRELCN